MREIRTAQSRAFSARLSRSLCLRFVCDSLSPLPPRFLSLSIVEWLTLSLTLSPRLPRETGPTIARSLSFLLFALLSLSLPFFHIVVQEASDTQCINRHLHSIKSVTLLLSPKRVFFFFFSFFFLLLYPCTPRIASWLCDTRWTHCFLHPHESTIILSNWPDELLFAESHRAHVIFFTVNCLSYSLHRLQCHLQLFICELCALPLHARVFNCHKEKEEEETYYHLFILFWNSVCHVASNQILNHWKVSVICLTHPSPGLCLFAHLLPCISPAGCVVFIFFFSSLSLFFTRFTITISKVTLFKSVSSLSLFLALSAWARCQPSCCWQSPFFLCRLWWLFQWIGNRISSLLSHCLRSKGNFDIFSLSLSLFPSTAKCNCSFYQLSFSPPTAAATAVIKVTAQCTQLLIKWEQIRERREISLQSHASIHDHTVLIGYQGC